MSLIISEIKETLEMRCHSRANKLTWNDLYDQQLDRLYCPEQPWSSQTDREINEVSDVSAATTPAATNELKSNKLSYLHEW